MVLFYNLFIYFENILYHIIRGNGLNGKLGHGDSKGIIVPKPISYFINKEVSYISCKFYLIFYS